MTQSNVHLVIKRSPIAKVHQLRSLRESDVLILISTTTTLCKVDCQRIRYSQSRSISSPNLNGHGTRTISYANGRTHAVYIIRKRTPHTLNGFILLRPSEIVSATYILPSNLMRECSRRVNLSLTLAQSAKVSTSTLFIMLEKSIVILKVSLGRNSLIVNAIPLRSRHFPLYYINVLTQIGESLTILARSPLKRLPNDSTPCHSLSTRGVFRGEPLCQQRNRIPSLEALNILTQSIMDELKDTLAGSSNVQQTPQVIVTTILSEQRNQSIDHILTTISSHVIHAQPEQSTLTHTTTNITAVEQPTQSNHGILSISLTPHLNDFLLSSLTQRSYLEVHIEQVTTTGLVANSTILSDRDIVNNSINGIAGLIQSRHKVLLGLSLIDSLIHLGSTIRVLSQTSIDRAIYRSRRTPSLITLAMGSTHRHTIHSLGGSNGSHYRLGRIALTYLRSSILLGSKRIDSLGGVVVLTRLISTIVSHNFYLFLFKLSSRSSTLKKQV